jgi:hypothetical protein
MPNVSELSVFGKKYVGQASLAIARHPSFSWGAASLGAPASETTGTTVAPGDALCYKASMSSLTVGNDTSLLSPQMPGPPDTACRWGPRISRRFAENR